MALGGEVHHAVRLVLLEQPAQMRAVANVDALECVVRVTGSVWDVIEIGGVGQLVEIDHTPSSVGQEVAADRGADEACAAGDKDSGALEAHEDGSCRLGKYA